MTARASTADRRAVVLAAVVGAPVAALGLGAGIVTFVPLPEASALGLGSQLILPLWVALACTLPLATSGRRAWWWVAALSLPGILAVWMRR